MQTFSRVQMLIGSNNLEKLKNASVAVFGIGGVGGFTAEALARSGVGSIALFDADVVSKSNINRQIIATEQTVGLDKVEVMKQRLLSINPNLKIEIQKVFYLPENADKFDLSKYDYVVDAVDTVSAKLEIIMRAKNSNVPVISCMGTGGKLDITALKVADIEKTEGCPLARTMRRELKKRGIKNVKVVYSTEQVNFFEGEKESAEKTKAGRPVPPSMIFVPASAGLLLAKEVVFDLIEKE